MLGGIELVVVLGVLVWAWQQPWRPLWVLVGVAVVYPRTLPQFFPWGNSTTALLLYLTLGLTALGVVRCARDRPLVEGEVAPFTILVVPLGAAVLSLQIELGALLPPFTIAAVVVYVAALTRQHPGVVRSIVAALPTIGAAEAVLAGVQYAAGSWGTYGVENADATAYDGRAGGTFGHPVILGAFLAVAVAVAITHRPRAWPALALISAGGIVASGSRSALIALGVGLVLAVIVQRCEPRPRTKGDPVLGTLLGAGALLIIVLAFGDTISETLDSVTNERYTEFSASSSYLTHSARTDTAWALITDGPGAFLIGRGPGAAANYLATVDLGDNQAATFDNTYLTWWIDVGLIGLLVALALITAAVRHRPGVLGGLAALGVTLYSFDYSAWLPALLLLGLLLGWAYGSSPASAGPTSHLQVSGEPPSAALARETLYRLSRHIYRPGTPRLAS